MTSFRCARPAAARVRARRGGPASDSPGGRCHVATPWRRTRDPHATPRGSAMMTHDERPLPRREPRRAPRCGLAASSSGSRRSRSARRSPGGSRAAPTRWTTGARSSPGCTPRTGWSPRSTTATRTRAGAHRRDHPRRARAAAAGPERRATPRAPGGPWSPSTNDILRDRGLALQAIACVDAAIWDVFGRAVGLPLHRLWGSVDRLAPDQRHRRLLPPDRSTRRATSSALRRGRVRRHEVQGRRPDARPRTPTRVRAAREAAGPDFALMVDANQGYDRAAGGGVRAPASRTSTSAGSRSRAAGPTTGAGCATSATRPASRSAPARARRRCAGSAT